MNLEAGTAGGLWAGYMSGPAVDPADLCSHHYIVIMLSLQSEFTLELRFRIIVNTSIIFIDLEYRGSCLSGQVHICTSNVLKSVASITAMLFRTRIFRLILHV